MKKNLVLTLTGADRVGIVEEVTRSVLNFNGNVDASRMARLGGEFAMLMLISVEEDQYPDLENELLNLKQKGFSVITRQTAPPDSRQFTGYVPFHVEINGADHEGIIHHVTQYLAKQGINIETMDTNMVKAPMSGTPLFSMSAIVLVPPHMGIQKWQEDLVTIGDELNVDINVYPYKG